MKLLDWIIIIVLIAVLIIAIIYYFDRTHNECINNPFVYGSKQLKERSGYEVEGIVWFITDFYNEKKIYFNTTNSEYK